jgi:hypothetical protein
MGAQTIKYMEFNATKNVQQTVEIALVGDKTDTVKQVVFPAGTVVSVLTSAVLIVSTTPVTDWKARVAVKLEDSVQNVNSRARKVV